MAIVMVSKEETVARRRISKDGKEQNSLDYFGMSSGRDLGVHGVVVEVKGETLGAHFHDVDQFQILLGAPGSFYQRTPVPALMLHYADAYATYGPLIGEDLPLRYFTLRRKPSGGIWFMPESREQLPYRGRRQLHVEPGAFVAPSRGECTTDSLIDAEDDGLEAIMVSAGSNATMTLNLAPPSVDGQFVYVADGAAIQDGTTYGPESLGWQRFEDGPAEFIAGKDGCRILILRYPYPPTTVTRGVLDEVTSVT